MKSETNLKQDGRREQEWQVFVGFDDSKARARASEVCEFMTHQFWPEIAFDLHLCDLTQLSEPGYRQLAITKAALARIVIIATSAPGEFEMPFIEWMNGLCLRRGGREGALVGLTDPEAADERRSAVDLQLRQLAHRAGLDYLTRAPNCRALCIPDRTDWLDSRAGQLGPVLEEILERPGRPIQLNP